ncbi:hypothetical protein [Pseudomonas fragi]|nr:hypothetical protein [Pseudomonas fragi]WRT59791.1 hypothetical protein VK847_17705 [Pseudomonas fragi]
MNTAWMWLGAASGGALLLALVWWSWHQGGLAMMQLGMGAC